METLNKINIESPTKIKINKHRKRINKKYPQKGSGIIAGFFGGIGSLAAKGAKGVTSPFRHAITRRRLMADMAKKGVNSGIYQNLLKIKYKGNVEKFTERYGKAYLKGLTANASGSRGLLGNRPPNDISQRLLKKIVDGKPVEGFKPRSHLFGSKFSKLKKQAQDSFTKATYKSKLFKAYENKSKKIDEFRKQGFGFFESRKLANRSFKLEKDKLRAERWLQSAQISRQALRDKRSKQSALRRLLTLRSYRRKKVPILQSIKNSTNSVEAKQLKQQVLAKSIATRGDIKKQLSNRSLRQKIWGSKKAEQQLLKKLKEDERQFYYGSIGAQQMKSKIRDTQARLKSVKKLREIQGSYTGKMGKILKKDTAELKRGVASGEGYNKLITRARATDEKKIGYDKLKEQYKSLSFRGNPMNRRAKIEYRSAMKKMRKGTFHHPQVDKKIQQITDRRNKYADTKQNISSIKTQIRETGNKLEKKNLLAQLSNKRSASKELTKSSRQGRRFGIFGKGKKISYNNRIKGYDFYTASAKQTRNRFKKTIPPDRSPTPEPTYSTLQKPAGKSSTSPPSSEYSTLQRPKQLPAEGPAYSRLQPRVKQPIAQSTPDSKGEITYIRSSKPPPPQGKLNNSAIYATPNKLPKQPSISSSKSPPLPPPRPPNRPLPPPPSSTPPPLPPLPSSSDA
jgi:hypothetical protein